MARSPLQPGPATDHYHDKLGVDPAVPTGGGSISVTDGTTTVSPATVVSFPSGSVSDAGAGEAAVAAGGGVQTVSLLGPLPVAFDTPGVTGDGAVLAAIPDGVLIVSAWLEVSEDFVFAGDGSLNIVVAPDSDLTDWWAIVTYTNTGQGSIISNGDGSVAIEPGSSGGTTRLVARSIEAASLAFKTIGTPSAGSAVIYALIATPS